MPTSFAKPIAEEHYFDTCCVQEATKQCKEFAKDKGSGTYAITSDAGIPGAFRCAVYDDRSFDCATLVDAPGSQSTRMCCRPQPPSLRVSVDDDSVVAPAGASPSPIFPTSPTLPKVLSEASPVSPPLSPSPALPTDVDTTAPDTASYTTAPESVAARVVVCHNNRDHSVQRRTSARLRHATTTCTDTLVGVRDRRYHTR
jgi:hypothetical protein